MKNKEAADQAKLELDNVGEVFNRGKIELTCSTVKKILKELCSRTVQNSISTEDFTEELLLVILENVIIKFFLEINNF